MVLLECWEFDVGIWCMVIELVVGFISICLYEFVFMVVVLEDYDLVFRDFVLLVVLCNEYFVMLFFVYFDWGFL